METEGNETELALQMMLKAKPEMSPLQSGPVIFINQDLAPFPPALADTGFGYWFWVSGAEPRHTGAEGESCEVLGCYYH